MSRPDLTIDLGDGEHRWGWLERTEGGRDGLLQHMCKGRKVWTRVDLSSGNFHLLVAEEPLEVSPSLACPDCDDHGWIRGGRWEAS